MTGPMLEDLVESTCSTPYVSATTSPGRSAPANPVHYILSSLPPTSTFAPSATNFFTKFVFSTYFSHHFSTVAAASMTSVDELFLNSQIRPIKPLSHLQRPKNLAPFLDVEEEDDDKGEGAKNGSGDGVVAVAGKKLEEMSARGRQVRMWSKSMQRRARSMSPLQNWQNRDGGGGDRRPSP